MVVGACGHIELLTEFAPSHVSLTINIELLTEFPPQFRVSNYARHRS